MELPTDCLVIALCLIGRGMPYADLRRLWDPTELVLKLVLQKLLGIQFWKSSFTPPPHTHSNFLICKMVIKSLQCIQSLIKVIAHDKHLINGVIKSTFYLCVLIAYL